MAKVAEAYGVLPSVAARDLDNDPEQLALVCIDVMRFARAKAVHDTADKEAIEKHPDHTMMERVSEIADELAEEEISAEESEPAGEDAE